MIREEAQPQASQEGQVPKDPNQLGPNRNLFDQEPFQDIVEGVVEATGVEDRNILCRVISKLAKDEYQQELKTRQYERKLRRAAEEVKSASARRLIRLGRVNKWDVLLGTSIVPQEAGRYYVAGAMIADRLSALDPKWGGWAAYVISNKDCYREDGSLNPKRGFVAPAIVFEARLKAESKSDERAKWAGLGEVLPKGFGNEAVSPSSIQPINPSSRGAGRWGALKQAELVPEKKK